MSNLLFHEDSDIRLYAVLQLGGRANQMSAQPLELGPLRKALHDQNSTVQKAVLQSLMRMTASNVYGGSPAIPTIAVDFSRTPLHFMGLQWAWQGC
jgi:hypothetical protein